MSTILSLTFCLLLLSTTMASQKIDASLSGILSGGHTARVQVSMVEGTEDVLQNIENRDITDRTEKLNTINRELTAFAEQSQASVIKLLEKEKERLPVTWETLWISNQLIVNGADQQLVNKIAAIENVSKIEGEKFVELQ